MTQPTNLDKAFVSELQKFARKGYAFDSTHALRKGTDQDSNAKGTQGEAFDGFVKGLAAGERRGYYEIPTGVGKTALFISLIKNYLAAVNGSENGPRVLIAVPSNDLVIQTAKAFAKFMPDIAKTMEADDDMGHEIDWENSDIGVQYSKKKHAHLKPKVLITTYQSLAKDEDRLPKDRVYPPNEYGFVVFDEGHNVTADKFGRAVERFNNAIELAVTATPEYSEYKTVAQKLPHCHYSISLAEAMNRGDLCPVNPYLIKTNYRIDERKLKEYIAKQNGRPLTQKQVESLLNQQARNLAAIKTYLLETDPNTRLRLFGQSGMIFAGGIQHCEDFCRQFEHVLHSPKYREMNSWLKEEGIAPIAYLHSNFPKEGLALTIDGQKRRYSKDEIKQLHDQGKILLLVSDKELKEGTDFPHDSVIFELVDRLSVVDATQRFGRGFRLDPDDPEKRCAVFNLVDENTYEIYKDRPHMLPIYAAEVLDGAQFREPMKRKHLQRRFNNPLPDAPETLTAAGFDVETNIERVKAVSRSYKKCKSDLEQLPEKTEEYLALSRELPSALGVGEKSERYVQWREKTVAALERGETVEFGGVPIQKMRSGNKVAYFLHRNSVPALIKKLGIELPMKTEDDLTLAQHLPLALGSSLKNPQYNQWRKKTEAAMDKGEKVDVGGIQVQKMKSGTHGIYCLHRDAVPKLKQMLGLVLPEKTENDLALRTQLPAALGISHKNQRYKQWLENIEAILDRGEAVEIGGFSVKRMRSGRIPANCLHRDALPALKEILDEMKRGEEPGSLLDGATAKPTAPSRGKKT